MDLLCSGMEPSTVDVLVSTSVRGNFVGSEAISDEKVVGNNFQAVEVGIAKGNVDSLNKTSLLRKKYLFFRS